METIEITGLLPEHIAAAFMTNACTNRHDPLCYWIDELAKATGTTAARINRIEAETELAIRANIEFTVSERFQGRSKKTHRRGGTWWLPKSKVSIVTQDIDSYALLPHSLKMSLR